MLVIIRNWDNRSTGNWKKLRLSGFIPGKLSFSKNSAKSTGDLISFYVQICNSYWVVYVNFLVTRRRRKTFYSTWFCFTKISEREKCAVELRVRRNSTRNDKVSKNNCGRKKVAIASFSVFFYWLNLLIL